MAVTIVSNPPVDKCINDDIWITASSTNAGTTNFKFVFDVIINSVLAARTKIFPNPNDNYGYYNAAPVVRNYLTNYFEPTGNSILVESNNKFAVPYQLQIGEEVSGIITTNMASGSYSAINFYYPLFTDAFTSGNTSVSGSYINALANFRDNFLTERDYRNIKVKHGNRFYVSYYRYEGINEVAYVRTLDETGTILNTYNASLSLVGAFNMFNLSASAINTWAGSTIITENTYAYEFYIVSSSGTSRILRLQHYCPKHTAYNVHFLNRVGGYDTFNFSLVNRRVSKYERELYTRSEWQRNGGAMITYDAYNKFNETKVPFSVKHNESIKLISDYITQTEYNFLGQLVASSSVYIEVQSMYFPIVITTSNHQHKYDAVDKVFNLEIEAEIPKNINSQFR